MIKKQIWPKNELKNNNIRVNQLQKFLDQLGQFLKICSNRFVDLAEMNISKKIISDFDEN